MAIYRCRVCSQPISREMAIQTKAGGYNGGYCQRHAVETPDVTWPPEEPKVLEQYNTEKGGTTDATENSQIPQDDAQI